MANLQLIKVLARQKNISLDSLAKELELTPQALSLIIRGNSTKIATLERIAQILDVSPAVFFGGQPNGSAATDNSIAVNGNKNKVNSQVDKSLALLSKKDEHIDRLLTQIDQLHNIIEKLAK